MVTRDDILAQLRAIDDPEMPISIVDLGIVEDIRIADAHDDDRGPAGGGPGGDRRLDTPNEFGGSGGGGAGVEIDILPTFIGCPALSVIEEEITQRVGRLDGVGRVRVRFLFEPPWSVDRISPRGRASLAGIGVTVPDRTAPGDPGDPSKPIDPADPGDPGKPVDNAHRAPPARTEGPVVCPFCESSRTRMTSPFGPTRCRMIYYCDACKNSFEHMKRLSTMDR